MALLPEKAVLVLPGSGALLAECEALARRLEPGRRVLFPGYIADMAPWYRMADAAATASRSEGLPFNVMEAMYCGLPVVASAVKGHTDLIEDGATGLLYPYGDAKRCAACIERVMEDKALRGRMEADAAKRLHRYRIDAVLPAAMELYGTAREAAGMKI